MKKTVVLLMFTALVAGCQNTGTRNDQEERNATLRCWYFRDQNPVTPEHIEYIRERSEDGDLVCKTILGHMYERGLGMPKDVAKAKAIYKAVAEVDEASYSELGRMAENGIGEPVDYVKARQLYERATAKQGNSLATVQLAKLMEDGKGGPQNLNGALALYLSVIKLQERDARKGIQRLHANGLVLSTEQKKRYNESVVRDLQGSLSRHIRYSQKMLSKEIKPGSTIKSSKLQLEFPFNSDVPKISLLESSGDPAIDQMVLKEMSDYKLRDKPILPESQKSWIVVLEFNLDSK